MTTRSIDAAILCGPNWLNIDVSAESGVDALIGRWREHPDKHRLVFSQSPPGVSACLVTRELMGELCGGNRAATIGALLSYQAHAPQGDPIARDANVQVDHRVREALDRAVPRAIDDSQAARLEHVILETTTSRSSSGLFARSRRSTDGDAQFLSFERLTSIAAQLANIPDCCITFGGRGDPLLHPQIGDIIRTLKQAGVRFVHVRTELRCDRELVAQLLASGVDVVSVDLHADREATYRVMMGDDRFRFVLENIQFMIENRRRLSEHAANAAWALPWIVPRLQRCRATYEDINSFYDRWQQTLGTVLIDPQPLCEEAEGLRPARSPARVVWRELQRRILVRVDGCVPINEAEIAGECAGSVFDQSVDEVWRALIAARTKRNREDGVTPSQLWIDSP